MALSLRDAIDLANTTSGAQEIWLPAWNFVITRERIAASNAIEVDVAQGDFEIKQSLTIRGVDGLTAVAWRTGAANDKVFELLGDYNNDGVIDQQFDVDAADYVAWRYYFDHPEIQSLNADGNDDGVINQLDYDVWRAHFSNRLTLLGVS